MHFAWIENYFAQLLSLRSSCVICSDGLKVKVTLEGQMINCHKLSLSGP